MHTEQYLEAISIDAKRNRLKEQLEILGRPSITATVNYTSGLGSSLFKTIGTESSCEHPDSEAARNFIKQLIQRRMDELDELDRQFRAL